MPRGLESRLQKRAKQSEVYVALLRGINVGGKNKLSMKDLAEIFAQCGCGEVKTFIQSGNVVFTAPTSLCSGLADKVSKQIEKRFGHKPPIILRSQQQMLEIVRNNPFLEPGVDHKSLCVMFLADRPNAVQIAKLDPDRSPGDEFFVRGQDIYMHVKSMADTKLTNAYFDSKLKTISTARNWRTTVTLLEMMEALGNA
jgi:uncharacterized protein (DUF1697 family)